ncbi:hypothetical protein [Sphingomonas sp.]|uniref:hypothetical protein n=1 Tax=Sphingomonas sp. TaxID=28214 RepID=UPI000BD94EB0|nr:hypothetical protein [Sphingomonas sp.]MBA4762905.1 hypothetical protein [Sphingomonas sp.]OYX48583.1 MAG: hypothetical protein B7Y97_10675 [Sphingomonas sp. 32-66-10]
MKSILITGLIAAIATPAAAQNRFRVGTVEFTTELPAGYCPAEGKNAAVAQMLAAADPRNVTHLTAMSCSADMAWKDYFILKTPNELLAVSTTTAELQRAIGPALNAQSGGENEEASKSVSRTVGSPVQIKGEVRGYGQDAHCVYLGAVLDMAAPERGIAYTLAMSGCMTVVSGKVVTIYRYAPGTTDADIRKLMPSVLAFAKAIKPVAAN